MAKHRLRVGDGGLLTDRDGKVYGRLESITLDLSGGDYRGGAVEVGTTRTTTEISSDVGGTATVGGGVGEDEPLFGTPELADPATGERLGGTDNRKELIDAYGRIFDKPRVTHSPSRMKAADKAFKEEPDFPTLVKALEGARAYGERMGRSYEFTDIFGTSPRTSDLASRIHFFVEQANAATKVAPSSTPEIANLPSEGREMVRQRQREVEEALLDPGDDRKRDRADRAAAWLRGSVRLTAELVDGTVRWRHLDTQGEHEEDPR